MSFTKQKIEPTYLGIIDIGTYKVRAGICKIFNRDVELIGYGEKRQDIDDIYLQEIRHIGNVSQNIQEALEKAELDAKRKVSQLIVNLPSSNLFFESSSYSFHREKKWEIEVEEAHSILREIETKIFKNQYKKIKNETGYSKNDLKLIIAHLSHITLDGKESKKLVGKTAQTINLRSLNIFLSRATFDKKEYIAKYLQKEIIHIIPSEFALIGLFAPKKDVVMIDMGNTHTSIIVKIGGNIIGAKKLAIGMHDLIKEIRKQHNLTKAEIIKKIDEDIFLEEKQEFLAFFEDILMITLADIVRFEVCPYEFFMLGGGANKFIKTHLENIEFQKHELRMLKSIHFITPSIDFLDDKVLSNPAWIDEAKSNINIYAMIKATLEFIKKDKSSLEREIKKIVEELN